MQQTLKAGNNWTVTIRNLPMYENGQEIAYTWREDDVPAGYTWSTAVDGSVTTLTNTHVPLTISRTVRKVWDDEDDAYGMRSSSLTVRLYADDSREAVYTARLNAANDWTATADNLPTFADGQMIEYHWEENETAGYTASVTVLEDGTTVFTNTYRPRPEDPTDELEELEDYGTPLGVNVDNNHVGDTFD